MQETLADVLSEYVDRAHYSSGKLAKMTGLSRKSINNWLDGTVSKPQQWQVLAMLAAVLHLTAPETNRLLQAAHHPTIADLRQTITTADDHALLAPWPPTAVSPFQAIPDLPYFVGRQDILNDLAQALQHGAFVNVCNVWGMGGVGKTAVAARLAYQLRPAFPDGILWANLATSDTMTILSMFAQTFGEDVSQLTDVNSRSTYVRGILANKRILIILDDAQHSQQLEQLLPPSTGKTAVIITTRHDLPAADGFKRIEITPFSPQSSDSLTLFAHFLGQPKTQRNQPHLLEIATLLGHLPLALAIAAARLAYTPHYTIAEFLTQIQQQEERLNLLTRGEDRNVRLSFDISYQALSPDLQTIFAALGTFGGESFTVEAVTAVTQQPTPTITTSLHQLTRLSLLRPETNHRYSLHPLLRDYAREKISQDNTWRQMVDYYVTFTQQHEYDFQLLEREINNITFALQTASHKKWAIPLITGINTLYPFLEARGLHETAVKILNQALEQAQAHNQTTHIALLLSNLAHLAYIQSNYLQAEQHVQSGLKLLHQTNTPTLQSRLLYRLASINLDQGNLPQAKQLLLEALAMVRQTGEIGDLSDTLGLLGKVVAISGGDYDQVEAYLQEGYHLAQQLGDNNRITTLLTRLGALAYYRGQWAKATTYLHDGLNLSRQIGNLREEANQLQSLGAMAQSLGNLAQAEVHLQAALTIAEKIQLNDAIPLTLASLGEITFEQGKFTASRSYLQRAASLARQVNHPANLSYALSNLGAVAIKERDYAQAHTYLQEALALSAKGGQTWDKFIALRWWGELHLAQEEFEKAQAAWNQAKELAEATNTQELLGNILFQLARLEQAQGNLTEATHLVQSSQKILQEQDSSLYNEVSTWLENL